MGSIPLIDVEQSGPSQVFQERLYRSWYLWTTHIKDLDRGPGWRWIGAIQAPLRIRVDPDDPAFLGLGRRMEPGRLVVR